MELEVRLYSDRIASKRTKKTYGQYLADLFYRLRLTLYSVLKQLLELFEFALSWISQKDLVSQMIHLMVIFAPVQGASPLNPNVPLNLCILRSL